MRFHRHLLLAIAFLCPAALAAQTAVLSPPSLSNVPKGATSTNPFWQHLVITLSRNPSADNTITVNLPDGVSIADVDGDGQVDDEVSVDSESAAGTGYSETSGTTASQILLRSPTGGQAGPVHVQFPIRTPTSPTASGTVYGQISFANGQENTIPAGTLTLTYVEPRNLSLIPFTRLFVESAADTTTNLQGDGYPAAPSPAFTAPLPDLVSDQRGSRGSSALSLAGVLFGDGNDGNDATYSFWFSTRDTLSHVDTTVAIPARDRTTGKLARVNEGSDAAIAFDVSALEDTTYFLYMSSNLTGDFPLVRSRGILVRHLPVVLSVGRFQSDDADFLDSGLFLDFDTGQSGRPGQARRRVDLVFQVVDYDDSASVRLFYAAADTLDTTFVQTSGTSPSRALSGLQNATDIDSTAGLREGRDSTLTWQIVTDDTTFAATGDYYIYAVVTDGKNIGIGRSAHTYRVRHSPLLDLDVRQSRTLNTGGTKPERYYAITWNQDSGRDGDVALADSATIALYYSTSDSFPVPGGTAALEAAAADSTRDTHLIASGLDEQADGREDNQHVWDLWTYVNPDDDGVPKEGVAYYLYGIIAADTTRRIVRWEDEAAQPRRLTFVHDPYLRIKAPRKPLQVDGRQSFQVVWEAKDVDDGAGIWVVLTSGTAGRILGETSTYGAIAADTARAWVASSADGSVAGGAPLSEDQVSSFTARPARLVKDLDGGANPIVDGEYYVYVIIDPTAASPPPADSPAFRAPELVTLSGLQPDGATGLAAPALEILPGHFTAMMNGDTTTLEIRPHANGHRVDLVSCFMSLDTTFFRVLDQDTVASGVQPFAVNGILGGLTLRDTILAGADSTTAGKWLLDLVYFEQDDTDLLDGDLSLATVQVVSKDTVGTTQVMIDNFGNRQTAFYRNGEEVAVLPPQVGATAVFKTRGTISGRVLLQGRSSYGGVVTFFLRDRNSFLPISDSLFAATNDADTTKAGIQDSTDQKGNYTLTQVPTGNYHLAAHLDRYLDGQYPQVQVDPEEQLTGIDPTFLADGVTDAGVLLGGDVTGYVDTSGSSIPDNEVDQLDVDFVVSYFGQTVSADHAGRLADIDGDSLVWVADLNMVAANFNRDGVEPVYKPVVGGGENQGTFRVIAAGGEEIAVEVVVEGVADFRAYGFRLVFDPELLTLEGCAPGDVFGGRPAVYATEESPGEVAFGAALAGAQRGTSAGGTLARLVFTRKNPQAPMHLELRRAEWVDSGDRVFTPAPESVLPTVHALLPNYPNPFNPHTALRVVIPHKDRVALTIYDTAGQAVCSLAAGELPAGIHTFVWNGRDDQGLPVASGVYLVQMRAQGFVETGKMLLLR